MPISTKDPKYLYALVELMERCGASNEEILAQIKEYNMCNCQEGTAGKERTKKRELVASSRE